MHNSIVCILVLLTLFSTGCRSTTENQVTEFNKGNFKIEVRSQEFNGSGTHNIDVCVVQSSSHAFPADKEQCLMHGYDIDDLSVEWQSDRDVNISFNCGRISSFRNYASVPVQGSSPVEFHAQLVDKCDTSKAASQ